MTEQSNLLLRKQLGELNKNPVEGFSAGLIDDDDIYQWEVVVIGPQDTLFEGGFFKAHLIFPKDYPLRPPKMKFITERMRTERDSLKETIDELHCVQAQEGQLSTGLFPLATAEGSDSLAAEITTPEIREHLIRLQHENKMLKLAQEGSDNEKIALLQSLLEDANRRKNELETENRLINQRVIEGQGQVEELQKNLQEQGVKADDSANIKKKHQEHMDKLRELNDELLKKNAYIDDLEPKFNSNSQRVDELEDALKKKEDDMKQMEDRYKKYLEKAKSVIRTLDPKQNQGSGPEVQALKNQLQEKDRMLHSLEKEMDKTKTQRDYEEKLIVSAWYNMGISLQKKAAEDRLASSGSGQSFLARQRQATSSRRTYPGHVQPATASNITA
ncbi:unnamed protein product [Arctogadus glacialis]